MFGFIQENICFNEFISINKSGTPCLDLERYWQVEPPLEPRIIPVARGVALRAESY